MQALVLGPQAGHSRQRAIAFWLAIALVAPIGWLGAQGMNLSRYGRVRVDSTSPQPGNIAKRAVDGIVGDSSCWVSDDTSGPHWLEVELPDRFLIGSAHVFSGKAGANPLARFRLEYWRGQAWHPVPGATVEGNRETQRALRFASPVLTAKVRLLIPTDGQVAVTELAVFPASLPEPVPIDTGVELEVGLTPAVTASSQRDAVSRPFLATDGVVHDASAWASKSDDKAPWLALEFNKPRAIATAHIYTGEDEGASSPLADFHLEYRPAEKDDWQVVDGAAVRGNKEGAVRLDFATVVAAGVRVVVDKPQKALVRELVLLPPNGGKGYPAGTQVRVGPPATDGFAVYWDHLYTLGTANADLVVGRGEDQVVLQTVGTDIPTSQLYHVLNVIGTDYFRVVNRETAECLEVAGGSLQADAPIREGRYRALDYQLWRVVGAGDSPRRFVNVHSGMALAASQATAGAALVQRPYTDTASGQSWRITFRRPFPKKGLAEMGTGRKMTDQRLSHYYNWGKHPSGGMPDHIHHEPMQWGNYGWEEMALLQADWLSTGRPIYLMGFNEPDRPDQAKLSPEDVVRLWSRLEAVELPLVAPAPSWWNNGWAWKFFKMAKAQGLRYDCVAIHVYITGGPNANQFMNMCENASKSYGRPVWNTEWNIVNWGGPAWWTAAEEYTWMSEVLHRMERSQAVARYDFFPFSPHWPNGAPGAPWSDGVTMTPLGRLYGAWDGDMQIREGIWYYLHSRGTHRRISAGDGPGLVEIDDMGPPTNWYLVKVDQGAYGIVSRQGDRRLAVIDGKLALAGRNTGGKQAQWRFVPTEHGWHIIQNASSGQRLRASKEGAVVLASEDVLDRSTQWRLIKPYDAGAEVGKPDDLAPFPPHDLSVAEGYNVIKVTWLNASPPADFAGYKLFRSDGGDYRLLAEGLTSTSYTDTGVENGKTYCYKASCSDLSGNESAFSETVAGAANNWIMVDDRDPSVTMDDKWGTWKGHGGYMRTESFCESKGATASFTFTSDRIRVYAFQRADLGIADILIDGKLVGSVDCYAQKTDYHALVFEKSGLGPGDHTIQVVNTARQNPEATGFEIILDAFQYVKAGPDTTAPAVPAGLRAKPMSSAVELTWHAVPDPDLVSYSLYRKTEGATEFSLLAKELVSTRYVDRSARRGERCIYAVRALDATGNVSGNSNEAGASPGVMVKVDDGHESIRYKGRWGTYRGNAGFRSTEHYSETKGAEATFTFTGDTVRYYGHRRDDLGIAEILIDGKRVAEVDCFWQTTSFGQLLYENRSLPFGKHTLTVRVTGRQNPRSTGFEVIVDAFEHKGGEKLAVNELKPIDFTGHPMVYQLRDDHAKWPADKRGRVVEAMNEAVAFYNEHGVFPKSITASYNPGTPTADAHWNGNIRFGGSISRRVALHEIAHTLGIGQHRNWSKLIKDRKWTGKHALAQLREFDGPEAVLHADRMHFWPYGLNYDRESSPENDRRHVLMVAAIRRDLGILSTPIKGGIQLSTWETQAEFRDIRVTQNGKALYASGPLDDLRGWEIKSGKWEVVDGALRQTTADRGTVASIGQDSWVDYTLELKARKISGNEGFIIYFGMPDEQGRNRWNLGGWGNAKHGLEVAGGISSYTPGAIEPNRWYDIRIELQGTKVKAYLNGKLLQQARR